MTSAQTLSESSRRQLLALLEKIASVANHARPWARGLTLLAALSALWLAYYVQSLTGASDTVAGIILAILLTPGLVCAWFWSLLVDVAELPELAERALGLAKQRRETPVRTEDSGAGGVFKMGGSLKQAASLAWQVEGLRGVIIGVMVLANPLFLMLLGLSLLAAFGLAVVALMTGLLALI